ncbi:glycosyltransferase family 2 protein [uncultured Hydrogenophaga sp.]|jgi:putative glycosyltransferase|uniref:glycosyltransferase family 2 protein n=1 Tax=uncultured Hydrogenophaga sp. TaxID=199683 RepID=UPI00258ACAA9|nr:glycosyltransferase family 2 protein [uncultured Hydrogenophaga sp.]
MKLSIVTTLYQSAAYIDEFHRRISAQAQALAGDDYEIVMVNDGSPDDSVERALALHRQDPHVVVVDLSRNFGHHKAMMTGLAHSQGQRVFLIDSDLEEEPEWLARFHDRMDESRAEVVYGVQSNRRGGFVERFTGHGFYALFRLLTGVNQPDNIVTARLMARRYVDALVAHREREINIGGLWVLTGFRQVSEVVVKQASSPTTYTFARKLSHLINAITSFSSLPLVLAFYLGAAISGTAGLFIAYLLFRYFFVAAPPDGYTSILASIWLFSGLIILVLGIQGIYIAKIFSEVKQRPYTIVRDVHRIPRDDVPQP